jgi:hypothetical protein
LFVRHSVASVVSDHVDKGAIPPGMTLTQPYADCSPPFAVHARSEKIRASGATFIADINFGSELIFWGIKQGSRFY